MFTCCSTNFKSKLLVMLFLGLILLLLPSTAWAVSEPFVKPSSGDYYSSFKATVDELDNDVNSRCYYTFDKRLKYPDPGSFEANPAGDGSMGEIWINEDGYLAAQTVKDSIYSSLIVREYKVYPKVISTYPENNSTGAPVNPQIQIQFGRKMNWGTITAGIEAGNTIKIRKEGVEGYISPHAFDVIDNNQGTLVKITMFGSGGDNSAKYTVNLLEGILDSDGKPMSGTNFSFTTVAGGSYRTHGTVSTDKSYYGAGNKVSISGSFVIDGVPAPDASKIRLLVLDPDNNTVRDYNGTFQDKIISLSSGNGTYAYSFYLSNSPIPGVYKVKLFDYDNGQSYQLASCTFTVTSSSDVRVAKSSLEIVDNYPINELPQMPSAITYYEGKELAFTTDTPEGVIYYSIQESSSSFMYPPDPDDTFTRFTGPITLRLPYAGSKYYTIKAVVYKGGARSQVRTFRYEIKNALGVIIRDPEDGATGVSVYVEPSIVFGRHVNNVGDNFGTISMRKISDAGRVSVAIQVIYDSSLHKAVIRPRNPLEPNKTYEIILSRDIRDVNGERLGVFNNNQDVVYYFTTAEESITVNGLTLPLGLTTLDVNKNPAQIVVTSFNTRSVTINGEEAFKNGNNFTGRAVLKPGSNKVEVIITYSSDKTRIIQFTLKYLDYNQNMAETIAGIPANGKVVVFDKEVTLQFPKGTYLFDTRYPGIPSQKQDLKFQAGENYFWSGSEKIIPVSLCYTVNIAENNDYTDITNKGGGTLSLPFSKGFSATSIGNVTVLYKPDNESYEILGGVVDAGKKTVTVPFNGFGRYAVVNMLWKFTDYTDRDWAKHYVESLWAKGIMTPLAGYGSEFGLVDTTFPVRPEIPITRGEFTVMIAKALGLSIVNKEEYNVFNDLSAYNLTARDSWGYSRYIGKDYYYIVQATKNGIVSGSVDKNGHLVFNYFDYITREQVATVLSKALSLKVETNYDRMTATTRKLFPEDGENISIWAQPHVFATVKGGYFAGTGKGEFSPTQNLTRPQAARLLYVILQKKKLL